MLIQAFFSNIPSGVTVGALRLSVHAWQCWHRHFCQIYPQECLRPPPFATRQMLKVSACQNAGTYPQAPHHQLYAQSVSIGNPKCWQLQIPTICYNSTSVLSALKNKGHLALGLFQFQFQCPRPKHADTSTGPSPSATHQYMGQNCPCQCPKMLTLNPRYPAICKPLHSPISLTYLS